MMKHEQVDAAIAIARSYCHSSGNKGGVTLVKEGSVMHWVKGERLPDPGIFGSFEGEPTYAVYDDGMVWETFGEGVEEDTAAGWRRVYATSSWFGSSS